MIGGSCVLLNPINGTHLNIDYLIKIIRNNNVTSVSIALVDYLSNTKELFSLFLRVLISTGNHFIDDIL